MKMYFSGIASHREADMLGEAGIGLDFMLADYSDWKFLPKVEWSSDHPAMDSGAYRAWKNGHPIDDVNTWAELVTKSLAGDHVGPYWRGCEFITMPDVFGDPSATWQRWEMIREKIDNRDSKWVHDFPSVYQLIIPVWQWGGDLNHLDQMVEWVKPLGRPVAIGGCVPWLRDQDEGNLEKLTDLCRQHGAHIHVLGLNWLKAIQQLAPLVRSCDTSKWLDGARYGSLIFQDKRTGELVQGHKSTVGMAGASREDLSIACARNLNEFVNLGKRITVEERKPARVYTLKPDLVNTSATAATSARCQFMSFRFEAEAKERHEAALMRLEGKPWSKR